MKKQYRIEAQAVTTYEIVVEADNKEDAFQKALNTANGWEAVYEGEFNYNKNSVEEVES